MGVTGPWEQIQEQAAYLRKQGYEADTTTGRNVRERVTYVVLTVRIPDEQPAEDV